MKTTFFLLLVFIGGSLFAQPSTNTGLSSADSIAKVKAAAARDSAEKALMAKASYPLIKSSKYSGVISVSDIDEKPDVNQHFKLLLEIAKGPKDSAEAKELNGDLAEVGRQLNLHLAAGIPKKNIDIVVVAHGGVLRALYNNAAYNKKYNVNNPNDTLLNELQAAGVKFIACGQAMNFINVQKSEMIPGVKVALSAQTVITDYQLKGYIHRQIQEK